MKFGVTLAKGTLILTFSLREKELFKTEPRYYFKWRSPRAVFLLQENFLSLKERAGVRVMP